MSLQNNNNTKDRTKSQLFFFKNFCPVHQLASLSKWKVTIGDALIVTAARK
jgi:hypothetical protein